MAEVGWSRDALDWLDKTSRYIAQFDPDAAAKIAQRILDAGNSLATFPRRGRVVGSAIHELSLRPYILRYLVEGDLVTILRIRHAAQISDDQVEP